MAADGLITPLLLEHVNINVPDASLAKVFYVEALGGRLNEAATSARQVHVNVGVSQFHLLLHETYRGCEAVSRAQEWPGHLELLTTEELGVVLSRLRACGFDGKLVSEAAPEQLWTCDPWGNALRLGRAPPAVAEAVAAMPGHPSGTGGLVALTRAVHHCLPGHAHTIARFYRDVLGLRTRESAVATAGGDADADASPPTNIAVIQFDAGHGLPPQALVFEERADAPPADAYDRDPARHGVHVALYLPHADAFGAAFGACERRGLVFVNERFEGGPPEFASARTLEDALACGQFRVKDCVAVDPSDDARTSGEAAPGVVLEHEVRSPAHRAFPLRRQG